MRFSLLMLSAAFAATLVSAKAADLSLTEVKAAQKLYTVKCTKCHERYDPNAYAKAEWDIWMKKMSRKSRLGVDQAELLVRYTEWLLRHKPNPKPTANQ